MCGANCHFSFTGIGSRSVITVLVEEMGSGRANGRRNLSFWNMNISYSFSFRVCIN